jgi:centromere protein J
MSPAAVNRSAIKRQENARKTLDKDRAELEKDMKNFKKQMMEFREQKDDFASHMKRERLALEQKERSVLGQSRTEREEIKLLIGEIEKMKEDQKHRDQKSKLTVDRLRKQVENLSHEASALKLEKERMSEEMRRMKMSQRSHSSSTPVKTEPVVSKSMKSSPMFAKTSPPPVYIDASPVEEVTNEHVKEEVEEQHVYDEEKVPEELLRTDLERCCRNWSFRGRSRGWENHPKIYGWHESDKICTTKHLSRRQWSHIDHVLRQR